MDMPKSRAPVTAPNALRDALVIAILRDGSIYCGTDRSTPEELPAKIRAALKDGAERRIYIRADGRARYENVAAAVDAIRDSGIVNITFLVDELRPAR